MKHKIFTDEFLHKISYDRMEKSAIRFTKDVKTLSDLCESIQTNPYDVMEEDGENNYSDYTLCDDGG